MVFSEPLLDAREDTWGTQTNHPFVRELATGTLSKAVFEHGVNQDHRYLINYTQVSIERLFQQPVEHKTAFCETASDSVTEACGVENREGNV